MQRLLPSGHIYHQFCHFVPHGVAQGLNICKIWYQWSPDFAKHISLKPRDRLSLLEVIWRCPSIRLCNVGIVELFAPHGTNSWHILRSKGWAVLSFSEGLDICNFIFKSNFELWGLNPFIQPWTILCVNRLCHHRLGQWLVACQFLLKKLHLKIHLISCD